VSIQPCVCGERDEIFAATTTDGKWFVECFECGSSTDNHDTYEEAEAAWNQGERQNVKS
jgi:hypothetical protein